MKFNDFGWETQMRPIVEGYKSWLQDIKQDASVLERPIGSTSTRQSGADDGNLTGSRVTNHDNPREPSKPKPIAAPPTVSYLRAIQQSSAAISGVGSPPEWTEIEITIDSGACESVMPAWMCAHIPVFPGQQSISGVTYEVANGEIIPNLGERHISMMTTGSNTMKQVTFQIADVHKVLMSVSKCADHGFECRLGASGGVLVDHASGESIPLERRENLYFLKAWVKNDGSIFVGPP